MPEPTPRKGESERDFISRCMSDPVMKRDYPKEAGEDQAKQRLAVCYRQWRAKDTKSLASQYPACAAQHFGPWMIEPYWFAQAVAAVNSGAMVPDVEAALQADAEEAGYDLDDAGVAAIALHGQMTKGSSSFGGASTVRIRQSIRRAVRDESVKGILLHIDSPGGAVAGTAELADDVARANETKPVYAYIEDLGASAAYYVASQARRISANPAGMIGSIGTVAVLEDTSGAAEQAGVKVHVISTGVYKAAGVPGTEITDEQLEYAQGLVDEHNGLFMQAIKHGRNMSIGEVRKLADGRMHMAADAKELNLIDAVESLDETVDRLRKVTGKTGGRSRAISQRLRMAELGI